MKKILFLAVALICFAVSCACADAHIEAGFDFTDSRDGISVSLDLYEQDGNAVAVSSLIPDLAVYLDRQIQDIDVLFGLTPEQCGQAIMLIRSIRDNWLKQIKCETKAGIYSGELFDSASTETSAVFRLDDFIAYLHSFGTSDPDKDSLIRSAALQFLLSRLSDLQEAAGEGEILITDKLYDQGRYETILFQQQNDVVLCVSADFTGKNDGKLVISYRTEGKYSFRETEYTYDTDQFYVSSVLRSGSDSVYRNCSAGNPLYSESFALLKRDDNPVDFQYILKSDTLKDMMTVVGTTETKQDGSAEIKAGLIIGQNKEILQVYACRNSLNRKVLFTDKKEKHLSDQRENAETVISLFNGMYELAEKILPVLPQTYQEFLVALFYSLL